MDCCSGCVVLTSILLIMSACMAFFDQVTTFLDQHPWVLIALLLVIAYGIFAFSRRRQKQ